MNPNSSYWVVDHLIRKEGDNHLCYLKGSGKCYVLNDTGRTILQLLSIGETTEKTLHYLSHVYNGENGPGISDDVCEFINSLLQIGIISEAETQQESTDYEPPYMIDLEALNSKAVQCKIFGMP